MSDKKILQLAQEFAQKKEWAEVYKICNENELSNILGKTVEAPDDLLYIDIEGSWFVGLEEKDILIPFTPNQRGRYK